MRTIGNAADFAGKFRMGTFSLCTDPLPFNLIRKGFLFLLRKLSFLSSLLRNQKNAGNLQK